jgi:hypothetical protein
LFGGLGGADDGGIARAAAQVASKGGVMVAVAVQMRRGHRHHKSWRAKATLAAVVGDHRCLNGVRFAVGAREPFNRADGFTLQLRQEKDAGVERARPLRICHHDSASATIAFIAALFRALEPCSLAQVIKQSFGGVCEVKANGGSVQ